MEATADVEDKDEGEGEDEFAGVRLLLNILRKNSAMLAALVALPSVSLPNTAVCIQGPLSPVMFCR